MNQKELTNAVNSFIIDKQDYYKQWIYDEPIIISKSHHNKLAKLHKIMHKLILHFVNNFDRYQNLIMTNNETREIIKALKNIPYKVGTFRTDFVYDNKKQPKLIEITCRFALNGLLITSIYDDYSTKYHQDKLGKTQTANNYKQIFKYLSEISGKGDIFILKGEDKKNESVIFKNIFEKAGRKVIEIDVNNLANDIKKINNDSWIISELTLEEIETLDINLIKEISKFNLINDFRTSLLIHDKQFFSVLCNLNFQEDCLNNDEINFFKSFIISSYNNNQRIDLWKDAKQNKDSWILKHKALGKSTSIFAGVVTPQKDWNKIFEDENLDDFILQKWVPQNTMEGEINGKKYNDYVTGTLLFFNDQYFGLGFFRASSFPITNVVDDRKITSLVLNDDDKNNFTNYIDS